MNPLLKQALDAIAIRCRNDRFTVLNESEFQSLLYLELCDRTLDEVAVSIPPSVIFPDKYRQTAIRRRVFREMVLNPMEGRSSPRPDLLLFGGASLVALPKQNGAISSWRGSYEQIIETKFNKRRAAAQIDREKYQPSLHGALTCINYSSASDAATDHGDFIEFGGHGALKDEFSPHGNVMDAISAAIKAVHEMHCASPASMIREKDFESWLVRELESLLGTGGCELMESGIHAGCTTGVRSQISSAAFPERRHDILLVERMERPSKAGKQQTVHAASAEIEIKTSHSNSHNWFDGRLEPELGKMVEFKRRFGGIPVFAMFRFGEPIFVRDFEKTMAQYPDVRFVYLCSSGQVLGDLG